MERTVLRVRIEVELERPSPPPSPTEEFTKENLSDDEEVAKEAHQYAEQSSQMLQRISLS